MVENFYQEVAKPACNSVRAVKELYTQIKFDPDILYIYSTTRHLSSCSDAATALKNDPNSSKNNPIAGIPKYPGTGYASSNGFSATYLQIPPNATKGQFTSGLLFDYIATTLTDPNNIKYYTTDPSGKTTDPVKNQRYGCIYGPEIGNISTIITDPNKLSTIMKEYFKALISIDNNTSVVFVKYYYKDSASTNGTRNHFDQIPDCDLPAQIQANNVIVFFENINIIRFLQVHNKPLYDQYKDLDQNKTFMAHFKDAAGNAE